MPVKGPFDALYPDWTAEQWFHYGAALDGDPASRVIEIEKCKRSCAYWLFHPLKWVLPSTAATDQIKTGRRGYAQSPSPMRNLP